MTDLGILSREEQRIAEPTAADLLAWLDSQRGFIHFDTRRHIAFRDGAWIAQAWKDAPGYEYTLNRECPTFREAVIALMEHAAKAWQ